MLAIRLLIKEVEECIEKGDLIQIDDFEQEEKMQLGNCGNEMPQGVRKLCKFFYYDTPLFEESGIWIPLSVPSMSEREREHEEWSRGSCENGEYIPDKDMGWNQFGGADKELTM
jgi:hypothetical protein